MGRTYREGQSGKSREPDRNNNSYVAHSDGLEVKQKMLNVGLRSLIEEEGTEKNWLVGLDRRRWEEGGTYSPESDPRDHECPPDQLLETRSRIHRRSQVLDFLDLMLYRELREWGG
jgi:hypothetical protein